MSYNLNIFKVLIIAVRKTKDRYFNTVNKIEIKYSCIIYWHLSLTLIEYTNSINWVNSIDDQYLIYVLYCIHRYYNS